MVLSAGVEQLPFKQIQERGILVTNSKGIHKTQMAEYTISMMLQVYRQEKQLMDNEKKSSWGKGVKMKEISGQTLLVLGTGAIGQEVARLATSLPNQNNRHIPERSVTLNTLMKYTIWKN